MTIALEEDVARWARIRAAEQKTSVSRMVGELLREKMNAERSHQSAMQTYLSKSPRNLKASGTKYPRRKKLH